jgi:hypothetical protein
LMAVIATFCKSKEPVLHREPPVCTILAIKQPILKI